MKNKKKILKWTAAGVGAILVAAGAYIALNSFDCEPPDLTKLKNPFEVPAEADNVYCGLAATTNVINEKTGIPVLTSVFKEHEEALKNLYHPKKKIAAEEKDAILAESAKVLSLFHEAVRRKTWYALDPSGIRDPFPQINAFMRLCRLADLQARRHLELGKTGTAIEDVRDMILLVRKIEQDAESAVRWIVAGGFLKCADDTALEIIRSGKATDEELLHLQDALLQFELQNRLERAQRMLNNDCMVFFQMAEKMSASDISNCLKSMGNSTGMAAWAVRIMPLIKPYAYHHNRTWTTYANLLDKMKERYRLGYDKAEWEKLEKDERIACGEICGWRFGPNFAGKMMLAITVPSWHDIANSIAKSSFQHSAVETIVAAARFKRKTGAYPKALAELVPEFMPAVPEDPYAKSKELKYDVSRGIIWTVGAEGTFNGETVKPRANGKYDSYGKYGRENRNYVRNIDGTPAK